MTRRRSRSAALVPALLLASAALLAAAPGAGAHTCIAHVGGLDDPDYCDAHDCEPDDELHLGHVVYHEGDNGGIHGCGVLFHVGVDGQGETGYICPGVAVGCIQFQRGPVLP